MSTQVKRFACDRCHGQKLRCPRPANGGLHEPHEPCVRCVKAGALCSITALPTMGPPNKTRKLNTGEGVPSRTPSPRSRLRSKTTTLATRPLSGGDCDDDQFENPNSTKAFNDQTSRYSSVNLAPGNLSPSNDTTKVRDKNESATPTAMNEFLQYLDFDLEFTDAIGTYMCDDNINKINAESFSQEENGPPLTVSMNTVQRTGHDVPTDSLKSAVEFIRPREKGLIQPFSESSSRCLGRYAVCAPPPENTSIQTSPTLTPCTIPPPTSAKPLCPKEDLPAHSRFFFPSPLNLPDNTFSFTNPVQVPSPPELVDFELRNGQLHEQRNLANLLKIQQQIYDCSEEIMQPNPLHQDQFRARGRLLCAVDRFISYISENHTPSTLPTHTSAPPSSDTSKGANANSTHAFRPDPSINDLHHGETPSTSQRGSPFPSAAVFYIVMACHARTLAAFDAIISTTPSATVDPCQSTTKTTTGECCFSIGSFTVRPGTSLESLLHLQVISHQLDHLNSALYCYMKTDGASSSSLLSGLGSRKSSSSPEEARSNDTLQGLAVQMVEQQGIVLKDKILARITEM